MSMPHFCKAPLLRVFLFLVLGIFFSFSQPTPALADTGRYLIDIGVSGSYQTTAQGWNNIYSGNSYNVPLVDSAGAVTSAKLTVTPTPPASFGNANGTTGGPYPATATQDSFYTSTTGYNGTPAQFVYTITGLSPAQTYNVTLYASRIGTGGEVRSTLYTIGSSRAVLNASENVSNSVTISNVTPVNGQIVITQQKDASNTNVNGFSYLGVIDITTQGASGTITTTSAATTLSTVAATGKKIVVLGSSTSAGVGASSFANSWVGKFTTYMQSLSASNSVVNLGVGGYNTYTIMPTGWTVPAGRPSPDTSRNITYALSLKPDAIIVNMPSNDTAAGYPIGEQQANFQTIVSLATAAGVPIWITTTQPRNFDPAGIAKQMTMRDWITATYGTHSIDFWSTVANADGTVNATYSAGDGIHLNDAGHQVLYTRVIASNLLSTIQGGSVTTVTPPPIPTPVPGPTVEASAPQTISAPVSTATLAGYVSVAASRTIASYKWEETSARGAIIQSPTARTTLVSNLLPGTYTFKLTVTDSGGAATSATVSMTVLTAVPTVGTGQYLIDIGAPSLQTTAQGWNNIYSGNSYKVPLVDTAGVTTGATFTISPTPPAGCENTSGTTVGPYPAAATRDSIFTSTTGYCGSPSLYVYTISGLSSARTYNVTLYASRLGSGGEARSALFSVGLSNAILDAAENVNQVATLSNITPTDGQITITHQKSPTNTNPSGFSYLGILSISSQTAATQLTPNPTVSAGSAQTITAPVNSVTLSGFGTAASGRTITAYKWTQLAGGTATIVSPNSASTVASNLLPGSYTFQLTATDSGGATGSATVNVVVLAAASVPITESPSVSVVVPTSTPGIVTTTGSGRYLIDFGHPDYQTTATGWNNIYSGHEANVALVDSAGAASPLTLSVSPTLPGAFGNTSGTTGGPYPATATQDSFFTSTTGYYGSPSKFTYTIGGLSSTRTYTVKLYASRIGSGGETRTALYTIGGNRAILNAAENISNTVTIANVTPVNGQIVVTQEKDASNNNANGFSYLGAMEITAQNVVIKNSSQLAGVLGAMTSGDTYISDNATSDQVAHSFTRNLKLGMSGPDVRELQRYLNTHGFPIAIEGEGSLGYEIANFGELTKKALIRLQNAHADEILVPAGLTEGSGVLGTLTRQYINTHP